VHAIPPRARLDINSPRFDSLENYGRLNLPGDRRNVSLKPDLKVQRDSQKSRSRGLAVNLQINVSSTATERTSDFSRPVPFADPDSRSKQKFRAPVLPYLPSSSFLSLPYVRMYLRRFAPEKELYGVKERERERERGRDGDRGLPGVETRRRAASLGASFFSSQLPAQRIERERERERTSAGRTLGEGKRRNRADKRVKEDR